jgi:hypothetical protein
LSPITVVGPIGRLHELNLVLPHLAQEIFEHLDGQLLAGAATIAKAERSKAGTVTHGHRLAAGDSIDRAEGVSAERDLASVLDLEFLAIEGHWRSPFVWFSPRHCRVLGTAL